TNYAMLEVGEPLHAFDYDILVARAGGKPPKIITRSAQPGEKLKTLDDVERELDDFTVLVCDSGGALSIAGVMGGEESEVSEGARNVLLEGAAWNFINIRRTLSAQRMSSEAAYRFSRGVHPAMAERGVRRGLDLMRKWTGGIVAEGLVDNYPLPPRDPTVEVSEQDVERWLGIHLRSEEIAEILDKLEFKVEVEDGKVQATTPDHRLDIGEGVTGVADLMEEIARIYGYDLIPETRMADALPPQRGNPALEREEQLRDVLVNLGLQEVITYRMTSPENEARRFPPEGPKDETPYVRILNPIVSDRVVMRHSLLASLLEVVERNARIRDRLALFEIGKIFIPTDESILPLEPFKLGIVLTGSRHIPAWQSGEPAPMDFFDLKGIVTAALGGLHLPNFHYEVGEHPSFHPGKCARVILEDQEIGVMGELHPLVKEQYEIPETALMAAEFDLEPILARISERYDLASVPAYPPVLEDLAVIVAEEIPAARVAQAIQAAGGETVVDVSLFDLYKGEQIGSGKKSLAYRLTYQALDRTLTDAKVAGIRQRIVDQLGEELNAKLRS
ncbi:MAG TPA: phenylalanine--tRNA ligase subunit beta, partial [Anaerolineales bacterium]|nr:phenylalanine--tRNA ligase subunit beta [Anaerolineales bacterium]